ncbi:MAG: hypothetical protein QOG45_104 [Chloroflexota bacterium]|nr:hypothetical protein [Chloroflexota bacterium]
MDTEGAQRLLLAERGRLPALGQATVRLVDEHVEAADQARLERGRAG